MHVILLHNELCSESLILCANEHYNYTHLVEMLPLRNALRVSIIYFIVLAWYMSNKLDINYAQSY